jgi:uncharacterized membrane protein YdbT with pleckstrin-like domain
MAFPTRLLTSDEEVILDLRPHWVALAMPALWGLAAIAALVVIAQLEMSGWTTIIPIAVFIVFSLAPFVRWRFTMFVVTNERVITRAGVIAKRSKEIPLETINDVAFEQSIVERILGAGDLTIESAGESGQNRFSNVRHPERVQLEIYRASEVRKGLGPA